MNAKAIAALAAEIRATVRAEVMREMAQFLASRDEDRLEIANLKAQVASLEVAAAATEKRVEEVAQEPRVHIHPAITVAAPAVHFAPTVQVPERKPIKRKLTKTSDGSFVTEEIA